MFTKYHINLFLLLLFGCIFIRLFFCEKYEYFDSLVLTDENGNIKKFDRNAKDVSITLPDGRTRQIFRVDDNGNMVIMTDLVVEGNAKIGDNKTTTLNNTTLNNTTLNNTTLNDTTLNDTTLNGATSLTDKTSTLKVCGISGVDQNKAPLIKGIFMGTGKINVSGGCTSTATDYVHDLNLSGTQFIFITITNANGVSFPILKVVSHTPNKFSITWCNNASTVIDFNWLIYVI